jgi:hypothetical protein
MEQYFKEDKCVDVVFTTLKEGNVSGNPINMMMGRNIRHFEKLA